jgi:hypothetical protein
LLSLTFINLDSGINTPSFVKMNIWLSLTFRSLLIFGKYLGTWGLWTTIYR